MKKYFIWFFMLLTVNLYAIDVDFKLFNRSLAYNAEGSSWEHTMVSMTYFENFTEATFGFYFNDLISFRIGAAVLVPFTLELPDGIRVFPIITTQISNQYVSFTIGTMDSDHNFPAPLFDPLINLTPYVRATEENNRIPNGTEQFNYGKFTHGYYEYGGSLKWFVGGSGELYMNWQLEHLEEHRERFDVGFIYALDFIKIFTPYIGVRYWHNGGHEYQIVPGATAVTENYSGGIGIHSDMLSILYLASFDAPTRDTDELNQFGHGLYTRVKISVYGWFDIEPSVFVSGYYLNNEHRYISTEADPFFRVPFYFGLNLYRDFVFDNGIEIAIQFVNGMFLTEDGDVGARFDQGINFDFTYLLDIVKK